MEWMNFLQEFFNLCVIPLLALLTKYIVNAITTYCTARLQNAQNEKEAKYITLLEKTITNCVIATNQTYVQSLKDKKAFDAAAQKEAFEKTYSTVFKSLSTDAVVCLNNIFGDLEKYVTERIEAEVYLQK